MKRSGNVPSKKSKNCVMNKLMADCTVNKQGLLIHSVFDNNIMRELEKGVVPQAYLYSILTILHNRLLHPTHHQLLKMSDKYFYPPNASKNDSRA